MRQYKHISKFGNSLAFIDGDESASFGIESEFKLPFWIQVIDFSNLLGNLIS